MGIQAVRLLQKVCCLCVITLGLKPVTALRDCPVVCVCESDSKSPEPWALWADCKNDDLQVIPQLTHNITDVDIQSERLQFIDGFAFSEATSLYRIKINARGLLAVHKDAFRALPRLRTLQIYSENTVTFDNGIFRDLPALQYLTMRTNLLRIPSRELCTLSGLETLVLTQNKISTLSFDPCVRETWTHFWELILSSNPLRNVTATDFIHFKDHNVTLLSVRQCQLENLAPDLFRYLPHLTSLDISQNEIRSFPPGIFDSLSKLKTLVIGQSQLIELPFSAKSQLLPGLRELNIAGSTHLNLSFTPTFLSATSLTVLEVSHVKIRTVQTTLFTNLVNSPVQKLIMQACSITQFSTAAFDPLKSLQELVLDMNPITPEAMHNLSISLARTMLQRLSVDNALLKVLDNNTFGGFSHDNSLNYMTLEQNLMSGIGSNTFISMQKLEILNLQNNYLTNEGLEALAFSGLYSLQQLSLARNRLTVLPDKIYLGITADVELLDLSENRLGDLTYVRMEEWQNLRKLNLNGNRITNIGEGIGHFGRLDYLGLNNNRIRSVPAGAFEGLKSLNALNLANNEIAALPVSTFQNNFLLETLILDDVGYFFATHRYETLFLNLSNLKVLDLLRCGITTLTKGVFENNTNLGTLQLTDNKIVSWQPKVFKPLQKLTILTMAKNKIASVPKTAFMYLTSLARLDLSGNPLACTCELLPFKHWINTADLYLVDYATKDRYTCASPDQERNMPLIDFQLTSYDCSSHFIYYLATGLLLGFMVLCTASSLTYRYRWYIRYYVFLVRSRRRQMQDALFEDEAFKYDVYVCYHNTSRRWVITELLPKLEYEARIKLCLHDRDWLAGPAIMDNIIESIEQSRKTLLLVNNGFAQSAWCREETCLAYHRLMETQRNMLTVVLLEDIQQENMDKILRSILTTRVYLQYGQAKQKERKFWKGLRAALRKREHSAAGVQLHRA